MKSVTHYIALFDAFSQAVQFRTSRTSGTLTSVTGALFTIAILCLTMPYLVERYLVLTEHLDQTVTTETSL
jgi:hypothetical protein